MSGEGPPPRWALALLVPVVAIFAVCLVNAVGWIGRPFSGFLFLENGVVVSIGRSAWRSPEHGRAQWARLLAVDGRPIADGRDVHAYVNGVGTGNRITYTLRRGTRIVRLARDVRRFTARDFVELFVPMLAVGAAFLLAGALVLVRRPGAPEAQAMFAPCLALGVNLVTASDAYAPYRFTGLYLASLCVLPAAIAHLALVFPRPLAARPGPLLYAALYGPFLALAAGMRWAFAEPPLFLPVLYAVYLLIANAALLYVGGLVLALVQGVRPRRPLVLALGGVLGCASGALVVLVTYPLLKGPISPVWLLGPLLLLPACTAAALLHVPPPNAGPATVEAT